MILRYKAIVRYSVRGNRLEVNDTVEVKVKDGIYIPQTVLVVLPENP